VIDHLARPGPMYWDFKCLICDGLVRDHPGLIRIVFRRIDALIQKGNRS
jgi:hypothetical protein